MCPSRLQSALSPALVPLSFLYGGLMRLRRHMWESGRFDRFDPPCPCISVGNISWGGTGKTPITDWLLGWAESRYRQAAVLSRGYGGKAPHVPLLVTPQLTAGETGDEPLMLALDHPVSAILVDPDRRRAGRHILKTHAPGLFILDDGFQHVAVHRDLDLVLLHLNDLSEGWGKVIPAGTWREGPTALNRAGAFLIKCSPAVFDELVPLFESRLKKLGKPLFSFSLRPKALEPVRAYGNTHWFVPDSVKEFPNGQSYALVSGVGDPGQVAETVTSFLGYPPERHQIYADHHRYTAQDAIFLENLGLPLICTRKDAVKLRELHLSRLWALRVEVVFGPCLWSDKAFPEWLEEWWRKQEKARA